MSDSETVPEIRRVREAFSGKIKMTTESSFGRKKLEERFARLMDDGLLFVYENQKQVIDLSVALRQVDAAPNEGYLHSMDLAKCLKLHQTDTTVHFTLHKYDMSSTLADISRMVVPMTRRIKLSIDFFEDTDLWLQFIDKYLPAENAHVCDVVWSGALMKQSDYLKKLNQRHFVLAKSSRHGGRGGSTPRVDLVYFHEKDALQRFLGTTFCHRPSYKEILSEHTKGWIRLNPHNMRVVKGSPPKRLKTELLRRLRSFDSSRTESESMTETKSLPTAVVSTPKNELCFSIEEMQPDTGKWVTLLRLKALRQTDLEECLDALSCVLPVPTSITPRVSEEGIASGIGDAVNRSESEEETGDIVKVSADESSDGFIEDTKAEAETSRARVSKKKKKKKGRLDSMFVSADETDVWGGSGQLLADRGAVRNRPPVCDRKVTAIAKAQSSLLDENVFELNSTPPMSPVIEETPVTEVRSRTSLSEIKLSDDSDEAEESGDDKMDARLRDILRYAKKHSRFYNTRLRNRDLIVWAFVALLLALVFFQKRAHESVV